MPAFNANAQFTSHKVAAKVLYAVVVVTALLFWLNQQSISLYCQQKYHESCEIPGVSQRAAWQFGGQLTAAMGEARDAFVASLQRHTADLNVIAEVEAANAVEPLERLPDPVALPVPAPVLVPVSAAVTEVSAPVVVPAVVSHPGLPVPLASLAADDQVFFVGDSLMQGVAPHMANTLRKQFQIKSVNLSKQSTGLAYPSFFNWPKTVADTLKSNPKVRLIVVFLGPNDPWDMPDGRNKPFLRFKTPEWESVYRQRVESVFEIAKAANVQVIWVGPPNMHKEKLSSAMAYLSEVYKSEAARYQQHYLSANDILGYHADEFSYYLPSSAQADGGSKKIKTRVDDGIHFTPTGQKLIAEGVLSMISFPGHSLTEH